jgi:predicted P-loop ATPase
VEKPRQSVMWATTNSDAYLKDPTGARRFWPIACGRIDIGRLRRDRDQLWAEAVDAWRRGEPWWLVDRATTALAREAQESRQVADAWDERIADYVSSKSNVSVGEVLQYGLVIAPGDWRQPDQARVGRYLQSKGWKRRYVGQKGRQRWRYFAPDSDPDDQLLLEYPETGI